MRQNTRPAEMRQTDLSAANDRNRKFSKNTGSIIRLTSDSFKVVLEKRIRRRVHIILQLGHPMFGVFNSLKKCVG